MKNNTAHIIIDEVKNERIVGLHKITLKQEDTPHWETHEILLFDLNEFNVKPTAAFFKEVAMQLGTRIDAIALWTVGMNNPKKTADFADLLGKELGGVEIKIR